MISTQQEQVASYTCKDQGQNTVLPNNIRAEHSFTKQHQVLLPIHNHNLKTYQLTKFKKDPNRINYQFNLQKSKYKQSHS